MIKAALVLLVATCAMAQFIGGPRFAGPRIPPRPYGPPGGFGPFGFGPYGGWNPFDQNNDGKRDSTDDNDYWSVPKVEGWIVPNSPDALTPWGVNIADAIPVLSAPEDKSADKKDEKKDDAAAAPAAPASRMLWSTSGRYGYN